MKGKDWNFNGIIVDIEDLEAKIKACKKFMDLPHIQMNEAERRIHDFTCGFNRGIAWARAKYGIKE